MGMLFYNIKNYNYIDVCSNRIMDMNNSVLYVAVLTTMLVLTGCGGGGAGSSQKNDQGLNNSGNNNQNNGENNQNNNDSNGNQDIDGDAWLVSGIVLGESNRAIKNAKISIVLDNVEYSTQSKDNGTYTLKLPQGYNYPAYFSGIVQAEGYKPKTLLLSYNNDQLYIDEASNDPILKKLQEQDVIFFNGLKVIHLGDDSYNGAANSQFQVRSQGLSWTDSFIYTEAQKSKYDEICISLMGRGIQSTSSVQKHNNKIYISKKGVSNTSVIQILSNSAESGEYTQIEHCFSLNSFSSNDAIAVTIESNAGLLDYDDFEMINITGIFRGTGAGSNNGSNDNSGSDNNSGTDSGSGSNNNSGNTPLCTSGTTSAGTVQCVGKDNINYLGGGFNNHTGDIAGYHDSSTGNVETASSCSVIRSGDKIEINIPSLNVSSGTLTGEVLQVVTPTAQNGQSLVFLTSQGDRFAMMQNTFYNGTVMRNSSVTIGTKTYTCSKY